MKSILLWLTYSFKWTIYLFLPLKMLTNQLIVCNFNVNCILKIEVSSRPKLVKCKMNSVNCILPNNENREEKVTESSWGDKIGQMWCGGLLLSFKKKCYLFNWNWVRKLSISFVVPFTECLIGVNALCIVFFQTLTLLLLFLLQLHPIVDATVN